MEVHQEEFENSSFWKKNSHLLLLFYLFDQKLDVLDYEIKLVDDWQYSKEDLEIIKKDWQLIRQKILDGKAHELSEGDTFYLGACTKGATASRSFRAQPFSKQKAYSLKQGYVNHVIANIACEEQEVYGKIIKSSEILRKVNSLEEIVISKFLPYYGKSIQELTSTFNLSLNVTAKNFYASITNAILGIELGKKIEEFEKADIIVKTVRLKENNLPKEDVSFPTFKFREIINTEWDDSDFKNKLESKFFFVFYQYHGNLLVLRKVKFWNMPYIDILEAKKFGIRWLRR